MQKLRAQYGDGPLHLIAVIVSFAFVGYAFLEIVQGPAPISFIVFFAGAIVAHDLIAFPVYSALNLIAGRAAAGARIGRTTINYIRVPALLAGFALIVWFPLILSLDPGNYESSTSNPPPDYLGRWLILSAVLFLGSGVVYALSRRRSGHDPGPATDPRHPQAPR